MEGLFTYYDMFATKGVEYLIILAFLILFIFVWKYFERKAPY
jgi:hypothetical protein